MKEVFVSEEFYLDNSTPVIKKHFFTCFQEVNAFYYDDFILQVKVYENDYVDYACFYNRITNVFVNVRHYFVKDLPF